MKLIDLLKKIRRKRKIKKYENYMNLSKNTIYNDGFFIDLRHPKKDSIYLEIGNNSIINGSFVFETETGKVCIGERCHIGNSTFISKSKIEVGNDVTIAWGCTIYDHDSHSVYWDERKNDTAQEYKDTLQFNDEIYNKNWSVVNTKPITIKDKVWIGMNVIILKGVTIGEGAVIGAGSVVTQDVPAWSVVAGNPAKVVKRISK